MTDSIKLPPLPEGSLRTFVVAANGQHLPIHSYSLSDMTDYARAAVALNAPRWRPMGSAPIDGTAILVLLDDSDVPKSARFAAGQWEICWDGTVLRGLNTPSLWMPLPAGPEES